MKELWLLYFIWDGLSSFLRSLSFSGGAGNALAFFLYIFICLLPVLASGLWMRRKGRKWKPHGIDVLLVLLSGYTFYLLYVFINPRLLTARMPMELGVNGMLSYLKAVYGGLWLSLLVSWLLLTWIRRLNDSEILDRKEFLYRGMRLLLTVSIVILTWGLLHSVGTDLVGRLDKIHENGAGTGADVLFALLRAMAEFVPSGFLIVILYRIKRLLKAMEEEPFHEGEVQEAGKLADVSRAAVAASVLSSLIWNAALFLGSGRLTQVDYQWEFSFFPLLTAFGSLILARYLREAGELRRDNEMII